MASRNTPHASIELIDRIRAVIKKNVGQLNITTPYYDVISIHENGKYAQRHHISAASFYSWPRYERLEGEEPTVTVTRMERDESGQDIVASDRSFPKPAGGTWLSAMTIPSTPLVDRFECLIVCRTPHISGKVSKSFGPIVLGKVVLVR